MVGGKVLRDGDLPLVTIGEKLLLVVQELLVRLSGKLKIGALDNSIDGAGLLAKPAVNALGHVDIISGGSTTSIRTSLSINCDGLI